MESEYIGVYYNTLPYIVELRSKAANKDVVELETCFTALYGYLLLVAEKEISKETQAAVTNYRVVEAFLKNIERWICKSRILYRKGLMQICIGSFCITIW